MSLLLTGMITVFVVLALVVITGNLLIRLVNSLARSEKGDENTGIGDIENTGGIASPAKVAAITGAVEIMTGGTGRVEKIEKL